MPEVWQTLIAEAMAQAVLARGGRSVRQLESNLARVMDTASAEEVHRYCRASLTLRFQHLMSKAALPSADLAVVLRTINPTGGEHIRRIRSQGRGIILVAPHMGEWDVASVWLASTAGPFTTLSAERDRHVGQMLRALRAKLGIEVISVGGDDAHMSVAAPTYPFFLLSQRLREGKVVCLFGDMAYSERGVEVSFFRARSVFPGGPAALALRTGAAILPVAIWREGAQHFLEIGEEIPTQAQGPLRAQVEIVTQRIASAFEGIIRQHPLDWRAAGRVFLSNPLV